MTPIKPVEIIDNNFGTVFYDALEVSLIKLSSKINHLVVCNKMTADNKDLNTVVRHQLNSYLELKAILISTATLSESFAFFTPRSISNVLKQLEQGACIEAVIQLGFYFTNFIQESGFDIYDAISAIILNHDNSHCHDFNNSIIGPQIEESIHVEKSKLDSLIKANKWLLPIYYLTLNPGLINTVLTDSSGN